MTGSIAVIDSPVAITCLLAGYGADQKTFVRDILPSSVVLGLYTEGAMVIQNQQLAQDTADRLKKIVGIPGGDKLQPYKHEPPETPVRPRHSLGGE